MRHLHKCVDVNSKNCDFYTDDEYWDCECDVRYIHPNTMKRCPFCGVSQEEAPESRTVEIDIACKIQDNSINIVL